jgi:hypothetical protein
MDKETHREWKPLLYHGKLQVYWYPQIPCEPFYVLVKDIVEARLILDTLAYYDLFQLKNKIKPDYSNAGGLRVFDEKDPVENPTGSWVDWYDVDGDDIGHWTLDDLRTLQKEDRLPVWEGFEHDHKMA